MSLQSSTLALGKAASGPARQALIPAIVAVAVGLALSSAPLQVAALEVVLVACLFGFARLEFEPLLVGWLWLVCTIHFMKRAIFLLGPQTQATYYSVLILATVAFIPLVLLSLVRLRQRGVPPSARILGFFIAWSLFQTLLPGSGATVITRLAAVHERILPMAAFAIGLCMAPGSRPFGRAARTILTTALLSVVYGLFLAANGPTIIERAWAYETAPFSLQGRNVLSWIEGQSGDWMFRSFSFYADPLTWGLFLLTAVACLLLTMPTGPRKGIRFWASMGLLLAGLTVSLTRTPWAGLLIMLATWALLGKRGAARPVPMMLLLAAGFLVVVTVGGFVYSTLMPRIIFTAPFSNPLADRLLTVGTLEARVGAWEGLTRAVVDYPVLGEGFAYGEYFLRAFSNETGEDTSGHNFLLETTLCTGAAGMLIFLAFLYRLFVEGTRAPAGSALSSSRRWLLAFTVGCIMTGYLNGGTFMNVYFFLLAGSLVAAPDRNQEVDPALGSESTADSSAQGE